MKLRIYTYMNYDIFVRYDDKMCVNYGIILNERMNANAYGNWRAFAGLLDVEEKDVSRRPGGRVMIYCPGIELEEGAGYHPSAFSTGIWGFWAIPSDSEHPEKVLEVLDYLLSDEGWKDIVAHGVEGVHYTMDENGNYDYTLLNELKEEYGDKKEMTRSDLLNRFVRRNVGADFFVDRTYPAELRHELEGYIDIACENVFVSADRGYKPDVSRENVYIEYALYMDDMINKIISGEYPVDYYDEVLDGWYEAGGDLYVQQMNDYIKSVEG